ncbi:transposase [Nonomuraea phyllanthi]|uniref:transposase n=1 Tax=Nonomuraea phyllanthi TaxID=2219224 RepID=UPI0037C7E53F
MAPGGKGRRGHPPEFRRKVLDLLEAGRKVTDLAHELETSSRTIYTWRPVPDGGKAVSIAAQSPTWPAVMRRPCWQPPSAASPSSRQNCRPPGGRSSWCERWWPSNG